MLIYVISVIALSAALCAPAWWFARKRDAWFPWDYATIIVPFVVWIGLAAFGFGAPSLSDLAEPVILAAVISALVSFRVFVTDGRLSSPRVGSIAVLVTSVLAAVGLRAFMWLLPASWQQVLSNFGWG